VFTSLGILKIASSLRVNGYAVDLLDLAGIKNYTDVVDDYISIYRDDPPLTVGITATTPQLPASTKIAKRIPNSIRTILGGPHVSLLHVATKGKKGGCERAKTEINNMLKAFDILVCGDGERAIHEAMTQNKCIIDADNPKSDLFLTNEDLDNAPLPARDLVDLDSYHYHIDGARATSLISQLGCPFKCTFCGGRSAPFLRRVRSRSTESVIYEIEHIYKIYGYTGFMFYDDELNVSKNLPELMRELIKLQKKLGVEFRLRGFLKAELLTEEQADLMYQAGFRWVLIGFESGDPTILKNIRKMATMEDNTRALQIAHKYGLKVKALMSIGHAGESQYTIDNTEEWLLHNEPDDFDCTIITVYPGTPYFDDAELIDGHYVYTAENGDRLYQDDVRYMYEADYYKGIPGSGYKARVWTDSLSKEQLIIARDNLEEEVRSVLGIPFNPGAPSILYEHSMGQLHIPDNILRTSL